MTRQSMLLWALAFFNGATVASAAAAYSVEDACGDVSFTVNQANHYGKSEFIQQAGVAESVGDLLAVFYDAETGKWTISPEDLKEIVLRNINQMTGTRIYGSAIAFEPDLWQSTAGLEDGVPFPANSDACLDVPTEYCETQTGNTSNLRVDSLQLNEQNETIYCPYAYQGSPFDIAFTNCSAATPHYCPTMDLARAYDYSDTNNPDVEWYTAPRCLFFKDGVRTGYWTSPYFDAGAGNINMVTYSQPIIAGDKFLGIATIDIEVEELCYGNQCEDACPAEEYNYTVSDCSGTSGDRTITYSSSDPSCPIDPDAVDTLSCSYVPASSGVGITLVTFGALGASICLAVLVVLVVYRKSALIKASQLPISLGFVGSGLLANAATFTFVGDPTSNCALTFWAVVLPITMQLAFLFGKVYRTYMMFLWAKQYKRKTFMSDWQLLSKIAVVVLVQTGLLLVWTFVEQPSAVEVEMDESVDHRYCVGDNCFPTEMVCKQRHGIVGYFPMLLLAVLVIAGCVLAFQSRKLPNCFCEAKYVMVAMYTVALVLGITLLVLLVGGEDLPIGVHTLLLTFGTCVTATWTVLVIFMPKFMKLWTESEEALHNQLRVKARSTASQAMRPSVIQRSVDIESEDVFSGLESIHENAVLSAENETDELTLDHSDENRQEGAPPESARPGKKKGSSRKVRFTREKDVLEDKTSWGGLRLSTVMNEDDVPPPKDTKERDVLKDKTSWGGITMSTVMHDNDNTTDREEDPAPPVKPDVNRDVLGDKTSWAGITMSTVLPDDDTSVDQDCGDVGLDTIEESVRMDDVRRSGEMSDDDVAPFRSTPDSAQPQKVGDARKTNNSLEETQPSVNESGKAPDPADGDWSCYIADGYKV